jgi:Aldo/keto reductase family
VLEASKRLFTESSLHLPKAPASEGGRYNGFLCLNPALRYSSLRGEPLFASLCHRLEHPLSMEYRQLGHSGLKVPVLSFGTGTFGGGTEFFKAWGSSDVAEATRLVDVCLDAGVNLFDTADIYSRGIAEEILGKAIAGRRHDVLISSKATFRMGEGRNDVGSSRFHLLRACEDSLRRLGTDYIDI